MYSTASHEGWSGGSVLVMIFVFADEFVGFLLQQQFEYKAFLLDCCSIVDISHKCSFSAVKKSDLFIEGVTECR